MNALRGWLNLLQSTSFRKWLRIIHRDVGYLAVGLTLVYAFSGLAINHIDDWNPNFTPIEANFQMDATVLQQHPLQSHDVESGVRAARAILLKLGRKHSLANEDIYIVDSEHLEITLPQSTLYVDVVAGSIREEGQRPRFLLRAANWLHLNRGKKAWTYIADGYAFFLLYLAISGLFMIRGRKGIWGRGGVLVLLGVSVPIAYVALSGGP